MVTTTRYLFINIFQMKHFCHELGEKYIFCNTKISKNLQKVGKIGLGSFKYVT